MKKFLRSHPTTIIIIAVLAFLGIFAGLYSWAINGIVLDTHRALSPAPATSESGFDLSGASSLDFRGLLSGIIVSPVVATTTHATPTTTTATTTTASSLENTFNSTSTTSIAQQLSGLTQALAGDNPNVTPVIFSDLQFTSISKPITVNVSVADQNTASALNNALEHSSHFSNVEASAATVASSGRIVYSITFVYIP